MQKLDKTGQKGVVVPVPICYNTRMTNGPRTDPSRRSASVDFLRDRPSSSGRSAQKSTSSGTKTAARPSSGKRPAGARQSTVRSAPPSGAAKKRRTTKKKKRQRRILLFAVSFLLFAILVAVVSVLAFSCHKREGGCAGHTAPPSSTASPEHTPVPVTDATVISAPVTINGVSVQNKTVSAARTLVETRLNEQMQSLHLSVLCDPYSMTLTAEKIGLAFDPDALQNALEQAANAMGAETLTVSLSHDDAQLRASLTELNDQLPNHAKNAVAALEWKENKIKSSGEVYMQPYWSYTDGVNGMAVDSDEVVRQVEQAIRSGSFTAEIRPTVTVSEPAITLDAVKKQTTLLGSWTTTYYFTGTSSLDEETKLNRQNRDINISKAVDLMKVIQLSPGKQFSYNKRTGTRSEKNGWALANAIYQGSHRPEPGGGVCQLSTTMYNALLLANIRIDSRRAHSMPVDYVDAGWDATVDDGHIDFKFTNNTSGTLYVFCYITKNKDSSRKKDIHVEVYGTAFADGTTYKKRAELVEELPYKEEVIKDRTMYVSDTEIVEREGKNGSVVNTFIDEYVNGQYSKTVYSATTTYEPISQKIRIGTKPDPIEEDTGGD